MRAEGLHLQSNDVVAVIGGGDMSALQWTGHLDVFLTTAEPGVKVRNLAREGDTVFTQKRDFGFPSVLESVWKVDATLLIISFARMESLEGTNRLGEFKAACQKFLGLFPSQRKALVLPVAFENPGRPLPDVSKRNGDLEAYSEVLKQLGVPVLDVRKHFQGRMTKDGVGLSPEGEYQLARGIALELGLNEIVNKAGPVDLNGNWSNPQFEDMRRVAIEKNKLWFHYYRPQNWAFLGGDRTTQPSSRDHIDPKKRWFPAEMEQFVPLIQSKEKELQNAADKLK